MKQIINRVLDLSSLYGKTLTDGAVMMYCDQILKQLSEEESLQAVDLWLSNTATNYFPMPAQIIALIKPQPVSERDESVLLARKIENAVRARKDSWAEGVYFNGHPYFEGDGNYYATWEEAAKAELGELGFEVVKLLSWSHTCDMYYEMDSGQFHAQLRDTVESVIKKSKRGELHDKLCLPMAPKVLGLVTDLAEKKLLK